MITDYPVCAKHCAKWWDSVLPIEWGERGGGESPVSRKWVAAYGIVPEDDAMNFNWDTMKSFPQKVIFKLGFEV